MLELIIKSEETEEKEEGKENKEEEERDDIFEEDEFETLEKGL